MPLLPARTKFPTQAEPAELTPAELAASAPWQQGKGLCPGTSVSPQKGEPHKHTRVTAQLLTRLLHGAVASELGTSSAAIY